MWWLRLSRLRSLPGFVYILLINTAYISSEYHEYKTESAQQRPAVELLRDTHIVHKRDVPPSPLPESISGNHSKPSTTPPPSSPTPDPFPTTKDANIYYNSTLQSDPTISSRYWKDLSNCSDVTVNEFLSKSHRRAVTVKLSFEFPFYGHLIKNMTIATGGFLYTGEYIHSWLAATQYIAPLMANFDNHLSNDSFVKYVDNGTAFTVEWERVSLRDMPEAGEFTFQVTLHQNGDIVFVYQNLPLSIMKIPDVGHPVKVGLSDAYILNSIRYFVRRKTIHEYNRIRFNEEDIKNGTVIYLKALPTCLYSKTCTACLTRKVTSFNCSWCPTMNICSDGVDRHRQDWLNEGCENKQLRDESTCSRISSSDISDENNTTYSHDSREFGDKLKGLPDSSSVKPCELGEDKNDCNPETTSEISEQKNLE